LRTTAQSHNYTGYTVTRKTKKKKNNEMKTDKRDENRHTRIKHGKKTDDENTFIVKVKQAPFYTPYDPGNRCRCCQLCICFLGD